MSKAVLNVGQCGADHAWISQMLSRDFGCQTEAVHHLPDVLQRAKSTNVALVLVNRILDRDGTKGVDVIAALKHDPETSEIPVMLVSNYQDAQEEAVAAGAVPGFGKAEMRSAGTLEKLGAVLG